MNWKLFIDDERWPKTNDWVIARSSAEAIQACHSHKSLPNEIAFDHDLGGDDTTMRFIVWLVDVLDDDDYQIPADFTFSVHSQNPVGARNIQNYMENIIQEFRN